MGFTLGELAVRFGCSLKGDPDARVSRVATLEEAESDAVTFLANPKYRRHLSTTRAGAVIVEPRLADACPGAALIAANPYATYARIAALLHPPLAVPAGIHAAAIVDPSAQVDPTAAVAPKAVIEAGAIIGARAVIGPGCVIMQGARVGADTRLVANVTLCHQVTIGERCLLHPGVVIGADGFGLAPERGEWIKVPQVGSVQVGNDVEIGANTTIDRGAIEDTVIGEGVKLDNQIQIAHNVRIGAHTVMAACAGIAGSTTVGQRCMIGGMVGIAGHLTVCDDVVLTGLSFVSSSIRKPGSYSSGLPIDETARFRKNAARFYQLDELARQVRQLRRVVGDGTGADDAEQPSGDEPSSPAVADHKRSE
ncbi:UDP-3-O-(3-hydroxymyristoyl)glucosamine N-acyltransferase [Povalibacter sp.]|uniref:UDP-3-O-(3-hydroxymyristoyl)glucosamine N-acyltransferase n=1 Tax=Povalibacter sp. TaxID=1962978 RepID=UPI002F400CD8